MGNAPTASHSLTVRLEIQNQPGMLGKVTSAIGKAGGDIGAIDLVEVRKKTIVRDLTFKASDEPHGQQVVERLKAIDGVKVVHVSDRTFLMHLGGKIEIKGKIPVKTRDDLSMAYTPGVARVCMAIHHDPDKAYTLTTKQNTVAVVSDGTAVLGLGDIGPNGAAPGMEGKALILKEFAGVDAWPLCLATKDVDEIVTIVEAIAPVFGGINLEDISAPRCFEIEAKLKERLSIPVFHDDQHGTAIVVLAAFLNALRVVGKRPEDVRVVMTGVGAAGVATARILRDAGVRDLVGCDRKGAVHPGRIDLDPSKQAFASWANPAGRVGTANELLEGADVFLGLSGPGAVTADAVRTMADDAVVFALANPMPEVLPSEIEANVAVIATGRSDYPNQINNVLAFPGVFRGALDVRATEINEAMKLAAGMAIAGVVGDDELSAEYIVPSVFNRDVSHAVASAVAREANRSGMARGSQQLTTA